MNTSVEQAKLLLKGTSGSPPELLKLSRELKGLHKFDLARRILHLASQQPIDDPQLARKIRQQEASCTEKDPDLPLERRHELARKILEPALREAEEFAAGFQAPAIPDQVRPHLETFGIAGAIHKRWWTVDAQPRHLVRAQQYYGRGWQLARQTAGPGLPDQGYTGINAAFVLDLLAEQVPDDEILAQQRRTDAEAIRREIRSRLEALPPEKRSDWWTVVTLAEACLGLGDFVATRTYLAQAKTLTKDPWEFETTARQLARLALLKRPTGQTVPNLVASEAGQSLRDFLNDSEDALFSVFNGRVGLALSGGGFRASLFHIGVLARLAELDMLRHVEVISCVSGGSIIGGLYYLRLRALLQSRPDEELSSQDYVTLVQNLEVEFTRSIQDNPRMKVFSQVGRLGDRTEAMGELLDQTLYGPAAGLKPGERPELRNLKIHPPTADGTFELKRDNWRRSFKVPVLILNATSLNTGHNWQFTAAFMGESPYQIVPEIDGNERLRRMYFKEPMPAVHQAFPLGRAVAASAAVPALFRPIRLSGLYPDRQVELVDGGVHDNQGIAGLLEQDCTVLLVSDACGQFVTEATPERSELAVLLRSNDALMSRVRELEYRELAVRKSAGLIRDFLFVHLKKELTVDPVDWIECDLPKESSDQEGVRPDSSQATSYGIRGDYQNLLAGIRTDLDAFGELESAALMTSGYQMTATHFPRAIRNFPIRTQTADWRFLRAAPLLRAAGAPEELMPPEHPVEHLLKLGGKLLFKGLSLSPHRLNLQLYGRFLLSLGVLIPLAIVLGGIWHALQLKWLGVLGFGWIVAVALLVSALRRGWLYPATRWFDAIYLRSGTLPEPNAAPRPGSASSRPKQP